MASAAMFLASCEKAEVPEQGENPGGNEPVEETYVQGSLIPEYNETSVTLRENTEETMTLNFTYETDEILEEDRTVTLKVDEALLESGETLLPAANYEFSTTFVVAKDTDASSAQSITFKANGLAAGEYVLPIAEVVSEDGEAAEPLIYRVIIRTPSAISEYELSEVSKYVLYVDTDIYDPRIVSDCVILKQNGMTAELTYCRIGWIVNLRPAYLRNESGRAVLSFGEKLEDVFNEASEYILPIQDLGSKVCLTIEGGGTGLGFCNLTEEQADDLVAQVTEAVRVYGLDGVNLWDKGSAYESAEANGLPAANTTSYPMLISKLREALGSGKLITVTDDGEPTSTFYDPALCGDIEVGKLIDYAWSGHYDENEGPVLVDPYHPDYQYVAKEYTNQPFSGLDPSRYGCISYGKWNMQNTAVFNKVNEFFSMTEMPSWLSAGYRQNDFLVILDVITNTQDAYEGVYKDLIALPGMFFFDDGILSADMTMYMGTDDMGMYYFTYPSAPDTEESLQGYDKWKWGWNTAESRYVGHVVNAGGTILIK